MTISIACPCGKRLRVADEMKGKKVRCPGCKAVLTTDTASAPSPAVTTKANDSAAPPAAKAKRRMVLQWFKGRTLEGCGTLRFSCPPLASRGFAPRGPVVLFADVCTDDDSSMLVESDASATLVEALPPTNPPQP